MRWLILLGWLLWPTQVLAEDLLPRRIALGVQVKPVSNETAQRLKLRSTRGVEVLAVIPDSTAAAAGLAPGDVIVALRERPIKDVSNFVEEIGLLRADTELPIKIRRTDGEHVLTTLPRPLPKESSDEFDILYGQVETARGRLRTVITSPKGASKLPGVLLLSGLGLGYVEHPSADPLGLKAVAYALTRAGLVVMRVDRPGCGDSEGGPARDADFESVVEGYIMAAKTFKQQPQVDADKICLCGFSVGAVEAPLVAAIVPVHSIAVFGALNMDWQEYLATTTRRQLELSGMQAEEIDKFVSSQSAGWRYVITEGLSPDEVASKVADLSEWVDENWVDGQYFSGIHYRFFQQLGKANVRQAWEGFSGKVLAMWGERDIVASKEEHELIARIANEKRDGNGRFLPISAVDHNLLPADESPKTSGLNPPKLLIEAIVQLLKAA